MSQHKLPLMQLKIYVLITKLIFLNFEGNHIIRTNEIVTLYHGSKSGIRGTTAPVSRKQCEFGSGFYMGTDRTQPLTLICNHPNPEYIR